MNKKIKESKTGAAAMAHATKIRSAGPFKDKTKKRNKVKIKKEIKEFLG